MRRLPGRRPVRRSLVRSWKLYVKEGPPELNRAQEDWQASNLIKTFMYIVYIIQSLVDSDHVYVGKTTNLKKRISDHNCGTTAHTEKYKPWKVVFYANFVDELKAIEF